VNDEGSMMNEDELRTRIRTSDALQDRRPFGKYQRMKQPPWKTGDNALLEKTTAVGNWDNDALL